jgi:biotin-independent malonate decarboxylase gamma subunit
VTAAELLDALFPEGHAVRLDGPCLAGTARAGGAEVAVVGTHGAAEVGVEAALRLSAELLSVVRGRPACPIVVLVDTAGQRMSRRDELLGLASALGHLAATVGLARARGHRLVAVVFGEASSGGVLPLGFMADEIHAVEGARPWVMALKAMARVTKLPLERLEALARTSPVLAPGLDAFVRLGGVDECWSPPLGPRLAAALARPAGADRRDELGRERGGRSLAADVAVRVGGEPAR